MMSVADLPEKRSLSHPFITYWAQGWVALGLLFVHDLMYVVLAVVTLAVASCPLGVLGRIGHGVAWLVVILVALGVGMPLAGVLFLDYLYTFCRPSLVTNLYGPEVDAEEPQFRERQVFFLTWMRWVGHGALVFCHLLIIRVFFVFFSLLGAIVAFIVLSVLLDMGLDIAVALVVCGGLGILLMIFIPYVSGYLFIRAFPLIWSRRLVARHLSQSSPGAWNRRGEPQPPPVPQSSSANVGDDYGSNA